MHVKVIEDLGDGFANTGVLGVQVQLGIFRRFVGRRDAGEFLDFVRTRFGVEAFRVALFANRERSIA